MSTSNDYHVYLLSMRRVSDSKWTFALQDADGLTTFRFRSLAELMLYLEQQTEMDINVIVKSDVPTASPPLQSGPSI